MILSGAPLSSLPLGAFPNSVVFIVSLPEVGTDVDLNGRLAKDLGLKLEKVTGWLTSPSQQWPTSQLAGRQGVTKTATESRESVTEIRIPGIVEGSSVSDARAKLDTVKQVLFAKPVRVITPDQLTRYFTADITALSLEPFGPHFRQKKIPVEIVLSAADPYHYDVADTVAQGGAAVRCRLPLGTAPVRPVITLTTAAVNPVITLRDYLGVVIATMTLTVTLVAGDTLVIDCSAGTIAKNGANSLASLTAGDFFKIDPLTLADREKLKWPTLETSAGFLSARYARAWR